MAHFFSWLYDTTKTKKKAERGKLQISLLFYTHVAETTTYKGEIILKVYGIIVPQKSNNGISSLALSSVKYYEFGGRGIFTLIGVRF